MYMRTYGSLALHPGGQEAWTSCFASIGAFADLETFGLKFRSAESQRLLKFLPASKFPSLGTTAAERRIICTYMLDSFFGASSEFVVPLQSLTVLEHRSVRDSVSFFLVLLGFA